MRKKFKIIIALTLIMSTLLTMFTSVSAGTPSGSFDTLNFEITQQEVSSGGSNSSGKKTKKWWIKDDFATGTRYVLRICGEEVPEKYYINHLNVNTFKRGTNVLKTGELNTTTWVDIPAIDLGGTYNHVTNWRSSTISNFGLTDVGTKNIIKAIKELADKESDTYWQNKIKSIDEANNITIEIRAEILVEVRTAEDGEYHYMTYNEIRKTGLYSGKLDQMNTIRDQRGLDALACKLYEKDAKYSKNTDGSVNCSCNYLKTGGTSLAPLHSNYKWKYDENSQQIIFEYNDGKNIGKSAAMSSKIGAFSVGSTGLKYYFGGGSKIRIEAIMPNICSVCINGKYYTSGMDGTKKTILFTPYRKDTNGNNWGTLEMTSLAFSSKIPNLDTNDNTTAYVFEGWDYIVDTTSGELMKQDKVTVTERWVDSSTGTDIYTPSTNSVNKGANISSLVQGKKNISGYTYSSTTPAPIPTTANEDLTITHYYTKDSEQQCIVTERWVDKSTGTDIYTPSTNSVNKGANISSLVQGKKDIPGYKYISTTPAPIPTTANKNITITHYYVKTYTVTIKYINDENESTIKVMSDTADKGTTWPSNGTIKSEYAVTDTQGNFGSDYENYYLDEENIVIDGKKCTYDNMPANIQVDSDKVIEFHYKLKSVAININVFVAYEINDEVTTINQEPPTVSSAKMGQIKSINKPEVDKNKYPNAEYVGAKVRTKPEVKDKDNIYKDLDLKEKAIVEIDQNVTYYVDFVFKVKKYKLTIEYKDTQDKSITDGNKMKDSRTAYYKDTVVEPYVPSEVLIGDSKYIYKERTDGKNQNDTIIVDKEKKVTFIYEKYVPLTIKYRDEIEKRDLHEDSIIWTKVNEEIVIANTVKKAEEEMKEEIEDWHKYGFVKRTDGKETQYEKADGISKPATITIEYMKKKVGTNDPEGLPVVADINITTKHSSAVVILGEEIKVKVPNIGDHKQMIELGYDQPIGGWNSEYAQEKYLSCECDVYYGEKLYPANEPIKIAEREGDTISAEWVTLVIPEWVREGKYKITSIVTSKVTSEEKVRNDLKNIRYEYNELYSEVSARKECTIEVKGKVYDFRITNLIEDKYWPSSLFKDNSTGYAASTLPIGQGDKKPAKYNYGISLGSTFFFNVNTIGQKNKKISIEPQFKYVTKDGEIKEADIYVKNNGKYEKLEETTLELQTTLNNEYKKVRTDLEAELKKGLEMEEYNLSPNTKSSIGEYSGLSLDSTQKVPYVKYFEEEEITRYDENKKEQVLEAVSHWYGEYRLPSSTKVMEKGETPGNGKEYKDGFIIVMFKITTQERIGEKYKEYLEYNNQTVGNQWVNEGGTAEGAEMTIQLPKVSGQTKDKATIKVENGYYPVAIYQVGISTNGSYEVAGTH